LRPRGSSRAIRCGLGTLAVLAASVCSAPSGASAACSRGLVAGTSRESATTLLDGLLLAIDGASTAPQGPAKPCNGPSCSGQRAAPTAPIAPSPSGGERWGCLTVEAPPRDVAMLLLPWSDPPARPSPRGLRIDRPPRLPASLGA
jgi:hypothetical protein